MSRTWKWAYVIGREQPGKKCTKHMVFRNGKYEENIRFHFLYVTMAAKEVGYVSIIDIQRGTRNFGRVLGSKDLLKEP
jgi:hypothetical protein